MKKTFVAIEALKVNIDSTSEVATAVPSNCWGYLANLRENSDCITREPGTGVIWVSDNGGYTYELGCW